MCWSEGLAVQAEAEEKARRQKEKMEAHLYTIIKVAREVDFKKQIGDTQFFDLVDHDQVDRPSECCQSWPPAHLVLLLVSAC